MTAREKNQSPQEIEREIAQNRADMGRTLEEIGDRVSPRQMVNRQKQSMRARWYAMRRRIFGDPRYQEMRSQTSHMGDQAKETTQKAREEMSEMADKVKHAPEEVRHQVQGNPMAAGLIAFGAGLLAGSVISETRTERDLIERSSQQMSHQMDQAKEKMTEAAKDVAKDVGKTASHEAMEMGKSAAGAASEVSKETKDAAKHTAEEARRQAG